MHDDGIDDGVNTDEEAARGTLRGLALWFLVTAVCFFPLIMNPIIFGFFDESDEARLEHVQDHLGWLRILLTGIGVTELALGVGLWMWGRRVAERSPGRSGSVARAFGWIALAAGVLSLTSRIATSWGRSAEDLASGDIGVLDVVLFLPAAIGFSLSVIVFGVLMIKGAMPTWLGIVWIVCGVLFWLGILPLWFFVAALVFGVYGTVRFRPGTASARLVTAASTN
jgi:hypothetical protein